MWPLATKSVTIYHDEVKWRLQSLGKRNYPMGITKVDRAALIGAGKAQMERLAVSVTEAGRLLGISRSIRLHPGRKR